MVFDLEKKSPKAIAAVQEDGEILTYGELLQKAEDLYGAIGGRTLAFILCKNALGALTGYVACQVYGVVPLLLDSDLDQGLLDTLIHTYHPAYLWAPDEREIEGQKIYEDLGYSLYETGLTPYPLNDQLALLLTTSGSTGSPKLVRQSRQNIDANAQSIAQYLELTQEERPITTLPMNYTYGLSIINSHLLVGATLLLTTKGIMQKEFWSFFKEKGATSFGGVPYTYEMLKKLRIFRMDLPSLKTMTQAGGKLTPELHKEFAEFAQNTNRRFYVMYGQTEATARMSYLPYQRALEKYGSMGIAIPGGEFSLIDVDGKEIEQPEVTGELVYRGPNVTLGYAQQGEDLIKGDERGGVLVTGDMAKRDADGYYYIVGRKKRFLKIYGNRVNLDECERMIKGQFAIDCACSGRDDLLVIFITDPALEEPVRKFIAEKTGLNIKAFEVRQIDAIPKSSSGKTLYKELPL